MYRSSDFSVGNSDAASTRRSAIPPGCAETAAGIVVCIPALLSAVFLADAAQLDAFSIPLACLILGYTFLPAICAYLGWPDFVIIALLWFPLEFSAGGRWIPKQAQAPLHLAAYGVSILLGLSIFLLFRRLPGMKYNLPRSGRDLVNLLIGFAACAPALI